MTATRQALPRIWIASRRGQGEGCVVGREISQLTRDGNEQLLLVLRSLLPEDMLLFAVEVLLPPVDIPVIARYVLVISPRGQRSAGCVWS